MHLPDKTIAAADYKVLLCDDDAAMLRLLSRYLINAGYSTRTASDGQEALEAIETECPDFIITDWEMPRINGPELCRQVREMSLPHYVYILFLTGKSARTEMIAGLEIGANDFLCKPIFEGELLARVRAGARVLELERRLSLMAHTDSLTGLMTQRCFYECLAKEWHRSRRSGHPLSCAMIDLDFFKQINDVHGHPAGDQVLKGVAELLQENCRASDSICRYGGEEFCILLPETNENDATLWAERVRQGIARMRITVGLRELRLTASFGVAEWRHDTEDSEQLVDLADQGLLYSKRAGRDRVTRYTELFDSIEPQLQTKDLREGGFGGIVARDVMTPLVVCLRQDETIDDAAQFFLQSGVASTPVLGEGGALAGFISEKDLLAAMISPESWQQPLRNVMRPNVISYEEETPIRTIYEFLCRVSMRRVVITQNGRPTGTISQNSMLRWYREHVMHRPLPVSDGRSDSADEYNTTGMASAPCLRIPDSEPANHSAV